MMNFIPPFRNTMSYPPYSGPSAGGFPPGQFTGAGQSQGPIPGLSQGAGPFPPTPPAAAPTPAGLLPMEQSFIENILRLNLGKTATLYMTYENNSEWNAKIFKGVLEAAGRDHIIISDPQTGLRTILLMVNLDFITIQGELNYTYPFRS